MVDIVGNCQDIVLSGAVMTSRSYYSEGTVQACASYLGALAQSNATLVSALYQLYAAILAATITVSVASYPYLSRRLENKRQLRSAVIVCMNHIRSIDAINTKLQNLGDSAVIMDTTSDVEVILTSHNVIKIQVEKLANILQEDRKSHMMLNQYFWISLPRYQAELEILKRGYNHAESEDSFNTTVSNLAEVSSKQVSELRGILETIIADRNLKLRF